MKRFLAALAFVVALLAGAHAAPINVQAPYGGVTSGFVDPTAPTFNSSHPMVACASSCSSALTNQNTDALAAAVALAAAGTHPWIFIPPGRYPLFRGGVSHNQAYSVLMSGLDHIVIRGYGATLMGNGNVAGGKFSLIQVKSSSHQIRFHGLTFSQRDLTGTQEEHSHDLEFGDANTKGDDFQVVDCAFVEGKSGAGDAIQLNGGGTSDKLLQRVTVTRTQVGSYGRTGLSFQHGTADMNFYHDRFGPDPQSARCSLGIHHEPTSAGKNVDENIVENVFDCSAGNALSWSGWTTETNDRIIFARNVCPECGSVGRNTVAFWFVNNLVTSTISGVPVANLQGGTIDDVWITNNQLRVTSANVGNPAIFFFATSDGAGKGVWAEDNEIEQFDCVSTGNSSIGLQLARMWINDNHITYRSSTALKCICVAGATAVSNSVASGWITGNICRNGKLADNTTTAGKWDIAADFSIGAYAHLGHGWVKDNLLDGGKRTLFMSYAAAQLDEGVPIVSGNRGISNTSGENEPALLRTESTTDGESLGVAAALSPSKHASYLPTSSCGSDAHALADGTTDGMIKRVAVSSTCVTLVTVTPANFGDGTSISCLTSNLIPNCTADLAWDATGGKWWVLGMTGNMLVNP